MTQATIRDLLLIAASLAVLGFVFKAWPVVGEVQILLEDAENTK